MAINRRTDLMSNLEFEKNFINMIQQNEHIIYKVCSFYVSDECHLNGLYQEVVGNLWIAHPGFRNESEIFDGNINVCIQRISIRY